MSRWFGVDDRDRGRIAGFLCYVNFPLGDARSLGCEFVAIGNVRNSAPVAASNSRIVSTLARRFAIQIATFTV